MMENIILPGDKLEMKSALEKDKQYKSTVYDVYEDGRIGIVMPTEQTKLVLISVGTRLEAYFLSQGGMYNADIRVTERKKVGNTYILIAELLTKLKKYQRREYYRFSCIIEGKVRELTQAEEEELAKNPRMQLEEGEMIPGVIVDISGGGLRFISKKPFTQGKTVTLHFTLMINGSEKELSPKAKIITSTVLENRQNDYENRVKFLYMSNAAREEIIKYIFDEERKNRKNGKR